MSYFNNESLLSLPTTEDLRLDRRDGLSRRRKAIVRPDYGKVLRELDAQRAQEQQRIESALAGEQDAGDLTQ
jgi:hypothetical protein